MRIVFMGTPDFALSILQGLVEAGHEIVGVVTQRDKPKGRGQRISPGPVKELALRQRLKLFQPARAVEAGFLEALRSLKPQVMVVTAYGQILPRDILTLPPLGCINVHASLLPRYRGAAPINWTIIRGEEKTGITTMLMDEGMDTGPILLQREVVIEAQETAGSLHDRLALVGRQVLVETLSGLSAGKLQPEPQNNDLATYAPRLKKEDGRIDWGKSALEISRLVRGLDPWPGAYTQTNKGILKIWQAQPREAGMSALSGQVLGIEDEAIHVSTGDGLLAIKEVQLESRRRMLAKEFLLGYEIVKGEQWGN